MERLILPPWAGRSPAEKIGVIRVVEQSPLPVGRVLEQSNVPRSRFNEWYRQNLKEGEDGLSPRQRERRQFWNRIPEQVRGQIVELAWSIQISPRVKSPSSSPIESSISSQNQVFFACSNGSISSPRRRSRWSRPRTRSAHPPSE